MKNILLLLFLFIQVSSFSQNDPGDTLKYNLSDTSVYPSVNRQWLYPDFQKALTGIIANQKDNSGQLFSHGKEKLYEKVISYENYWFLRGDYYPIKDKLSFNISISNLIGRVISNYYQKGTNSSGRLMYEKEVADFISLMCKIAQNQNDMLDEFIKTNPNLTQIQLDGFKKTVAGITNMLSGLLFTIEKEYPFYSQESICKLSHSFKSFYSQVNSKIENATKEEFNKRVALLAKSHPYQCVRDDLKTD